MHLHRSLTLFAAVALLCGSALASSNGLVISQVYGGGGNSGATYKNDFIELFNAGTATVSLANYSVQYASATGTSWQVTNLSGAIAPGHYYLIQQAPGAGGNTALPTPDATGSIPMSSSAAKVALVSSTAALSGATPTGPTLIDVVGYGATNFYEGSAPASALSNTLADLRVGAGCIDTDSNSVDFSAAAPLPRNSATAAVDCSGTAPPPADPTPLSARIHDIQGAAHRSPLEGRKVAGVPGFVTAVASNGFYLEDPLPDADPATSEAVFVYTASAPTVSVGQYVLVSGTVSEFRPGNDTTNLTTTEIVTPTVAPGGPPPASLPPPVVIGAGGRMPPVARIAGTSAGASVEAAGYVFDPVHNGIDFYESLEGMRVVVNNAVAVGPTDANNDIVIVGDGGAYAVQRSVRGGVVIQSNNDNPERLFIDSALIGAGKLPSVNVGDGLGSVAGVLDYSFGNFKLLVTTLPQRVVGPIARETTPLVSDATRIRIASFNVENLAPTNPASKFAALGTAVAVNLRSPDIIGVMEIQDNNGATDNGIVDATTTIRMLTDAIRVAGGPAYSYRQIDPVNDLDGGEPGGNIRQIFLFDPSRVTFVDRPVANPSTTAVSVVPLSPGVRLSASPGRIAPADTAWAASRKPLVGEFSVAGKPLFVIANHLNSKGGDNPLFGQFQPPALSTEAQRSRQADLIASFITSLTAADPQARVVVIGDLNDFEFSTTLAKLKSAGLADLIETLPPNERYTYVYEGNSEVLDHILVSANLKSLTEYDVVHINAEFFDQVSDHDPEVARLAIGRTDYTGLLGVASSGFVLNRASGLYTGTVTLTNRSASAITGPLLLSLSGVVPDLVLTGPQTVLDGMPTVSVAGGIPVGASVTVPLAFSNTKRLAIGYGVRVIAGP